MNFPRFVPAVIFLASAGGLAATPVQSAPVEKKMNTPTLTMKELNPVSEKLGPKEVVLDVRTPEEFAEGHVPGAINIDHESVGKHADRLAGYDKVYVHCRSGKRAQMAVDTLQSKGLKNLVLIKDSGMMDWTAAGFPEEKGKR
jgi:rhodanese-related sulfurtransferase